MPSDKELITHTAFKSLSRMHSSKMKLQLGAWRILHPTFSATFNFSIIFRWKFIIAFNYRGCGLCWSLRGCYRVERRNEILKVFLSDGKVGLLERIVWAAMKIKVRKYRMSRNVLKLESLIVVCHFEEQSQIYISLFLRFSVIFFSYFVFVSQLRLACSLSHF